MAQYKNKCKNVSIYKHISFYAYIYVYIYILYIYIYIIYIYIYQASAYEACDRTRTPPHMFKTLETCKKKARLA